MPKQKYPRSFRNLPPAQLAVFGQIAVSLDGGHNPRTIDALVRKGLIVSVLEPLRDTPPGHPVTYLHRYSVPLPIHMEWCQWCAGRPATEAV